MRLAQLGAFASLGLMGSTLTCKVRDPKFAPNIADVAGTVVTRDGKPVKGQLVVLGSHRAATDADGRFVVPAVRVPYDVTIVNPQKTHVTLYRGLRRPDLVLFHESPDESSPDPGHAHEAQIVATLSSGDSYALTPESVRVHFSSARVEADSIVRGGLGANATAAVAELTVAWDGARSYSAGLVRRLHPA